MQYPTPNITQPTDILYYINSITCADPANSASCNLFSPMLLFAMMMIIFFINKSNRRIEEAFAVSAFLTSIFAVLFYILQLLSPMFLVGFIALDLLGVILLMKSPNT